MLTLFKFYSLTLAILGPLWLVCCIAAPAGLALFGGGILIDLAMIYWPPGLLLLLGHSIFLQTTKPRKVLWFLLILCLPLFGVTIYHLCVVRHLTTWNSTRAV